MRDMLRTAPRLVRWDVQRAVLTVGGASLLALMCVVVARDIAMGLSFRAALVAFLPTALILFVALAGSSRAVLVFGALAINLTALPILKAGVPFVGGTTIFVTDLLVGLAVAAWVAGSVVERSETRSERSPLLGWPLAVFALALVPGIVRGHERYGATLVGQPLRIVLYAGIGAAMVGMAPKTAYKGIVAVFYGGTVWQTFQGAYHLATGTSQTESLALSTGGVRILALSTAMYLAGALVLALLNLELDRAGSRRLLHIAMAALAMFGIILSFGRTTFAAVAVLLPVLFIVFKEMRVAIAVFLPIVIPAFIAASFLLPRAAPELAPTLERRIYADPTQDSAIVWRERAAEAALRGFEEDPLLGVGFGRTTTFFSNGAYQEISGDPHNSFIYLLGGGGILALGGFMLLLGVFLWDAWRRFSGADQLGRIVVAWAVATWFVFLVNGLTGPVLAEPILLLTIWILMLLPSVVPLRTARTSSGGEAFERS